MDYSLQPLLLIILFFLLVIIFLKQILKHLLFNHKHLALIARRFYNYYYSIEKIDRLISNNWGYAPVDDEMSKYDADLRYAMQLYKELVSSSNGYRINPDCVIAEIGSGKGAGCQFLTTKFKPKKYIGVDYSSVAIDFCNRHYNNLEKVEFICADAHNLPIEKQSVDVVINVESSHIYKDVGRFLKEVYRILKKDGKFLFTDFRHIKNSPVHSLEMLILESGFSIEEKRIISPHIYDSCVIASERRKQIINYASPWYLKKFFYHYAVLNGTTKLKKLGNGEIVYFMYHLKK
jgi:ubiquinone/menaquinone biosynthesis C-methylase UbiE